MVTLVWWAAMATGSALGMLARRLKYPWPRRRPLRSRSQARLRVPSCWVRLLQRDIASATAADTDRVSLAAVDTQVTVVASGGAGAWAGVRAITAYAASLTPASPADATAHPTPAQRGAGLSASALAGIGVAAGVALIGMAGFATYKVRSMSARGPVYRAVSL